MMAVMVTNTVWLVMVMMMVMAVIVVMMMVVKIILVYDVDHDDVEYVDHYES